MGLQTHIRVPKLIYRVVCAGTQPSCSLWQRISVMQVMRQLCADAYFLLFLYTTYDAKEVGHAMIHSDTQFNPFLVDIDLQHIAQCCCKQLHALLCQQARTQLAGEYILSSWW